MKGYIMILIYVLLLAGSIQDASGHRRHRRRKHKPTKPGKKTGDFQQLVDKLWKLDHNRVEIGKAFDLAYQGHSTGDRDNAPKHLFSKFNKTVLEKPTFKAFHALLDNYNRIEGKAEDITPQEIAENKRFFNLTLHSDCMQAVYSYLAGKGRASPDFNKFKTKLYRLWFGAYSRRRSSHILDSSGFEHVFVGEINGYKHNIGGFHNWIHLYEEEKRNHLNYMGYLKRLDSPLIFNFRFEWYHVLKPLGSSFFGTSPEFEMSLYTAAYMMGYNHVSVTLDGIRVNLTCWPINNGQNIGTCYPSVL